MAMLADPPQLVIIRCPNSHEVVVPAAPGFVIVNGAGVMQRSLSDLIQDCPICGPFQRFSDGRVELHISPGLPRSNRPIHWCVTEMLALLRRAMPSDDERTAVAESGALRSSLEVLRSEYEARGVDFDAVVDAVVAAEELVSRPVAVLVPNDGHHRTR
jgi:hypothetical protein